MKGDIEIQTQQVVTSRVHQHKCLSSHAEVCPEVVQEHVAHDKSTQDGDGSARQGTFCEIRWHLPASIFVNSTVLVCWLLTDKGEYP